MSSNLATTRLLSRLPASIPVVEIADDVFAVDPTHAAAVRVLFADQPQVQFFLDNNIRANEVAVNHIDRGWTISAPGIPSQNFLLMFSGAPPSRVAITEPTVVNGFDLAIAEWKIGYWNGASFVHDFKIIVQRKMIGQIAIGPRILVNPPAHPMLLTIDGLQSVYLTNFTSSSGPGPGAVFNVSSETQAIDVSAVGGAQATAFAPAAGNSHFFNVLPHQGAALRENLVIICGPSVLKYGETFPGIQWFSATLSQVGTRMGNVVDYMTSKPGAAGNESIAKFKEAKLALDEHGDSVVVAFKGSPVADPIALWPLAYSSFKTYEAVPVDGVLVTEASKTRGMTEWSGGKWCCTVIAGDLSESALSDMFSKDDGPLTFKASSSYTVHLSDGNGTVELGFVAAKAAILSARRTGRTVTHLTAAFESANGFDVLGFTDLKDAAALSTVDAQNLAGTGSIDFVRNPDIIGQSFCSRLLSDSMFDKNEESLMTPFMTPQFFWSDLARGAV